MKVKLTFEHIRDYALPQRKFRAERYLTHEVTNELTRAYWQGYKDAIESLEQLIEDNAA
jgi:hypothetical protein